MQPAAKQGDLVIGVDTHVVLVSTPSGPMRVPMTLAFEGKLVDELSPDVLVEGLAAATTGSIAKNDPEHVAPGGVFERPPSNLATVSATSATVLINHKPAARAADPATTCNDPEDVDAGRVRASGTVLVGG